MKLKVKKLKQLDEFKAELKQMFGKDSNFTRFDFERYIKAKYSVKFYDSLQEYYDKNNEKVDVYDIKQFVDVLAFNIVEQDYRVACIPKELNQKYGAVFIYYSYKDSIITDMFIDNIGIKNANYWGIFEPNGEDIIRKNIKLYW